MQEKVRSQDTVYAIMSINTSATGRKLAWDFLKTNWETQFQKKYKGGYLLTHLIKTTIENFTDTAIIPEVKVME